MNNKEIGDRLRVLREQRKLTQEEVADVLGIKQPAYSDMENGHTAFKAVDLDKLSEFYGKSLDELLHGDKAVMHMHDHSTNGFNAYHMQHQHGVSEDTVKKFLEALVANTNALERLVEKQGQIFEVLSKR